MWVLAILQENVHPCTAVRFPHTQGLLEESKPCNEMEIFKTFVKQRIKMEHFVASENDGKRENFLSYWCYEGILATCTDAFELNFSL